MTLQQSKIYVPRLEISENDSIMVITIDFTDQSFKEIKQVNAFGIERDQKKTFHIIAVECMSFYRNCF